MTEALELSENDKVLEIGTGCGYQTAIIAEITKEIYTIEIVKELNEFAGNLIKKLGYNNVKAMWGDGYNGWPEHAPFDSIIITAAPHKLPLRLIDQLKVGGKMIVPVGSGWHQELKSITRTSDGIETKFLLDVRFVPMTGQMEREH